MKIEKINDNQIKCTLNRSDLASRQIKLSELAYGTEKAKSLFRDMMQQASTEFGFEAEDIPLMIEAIPVSGDCIILVITKVEDPEELDTRFSRFSPSAEDLDGDETDNEDNSDTSQPATGELLDLFNHLKQEIKNAVEGTGDNFIPFPQALAKKANEAVKESKAQEKKVVTKAEPKNVLKIFSFTSLDSIIHVSTLLRDMYNAPNSLYKSPDNGIYYLVINKGSSSIADFNKVCNILSEYGNAERSTSANEAYFKEHFKKIITKRALQKLQMVNN